MTTPSYAVAPEALRDAVAGALGPLAKRVDLRLGEVTAVVAPADWHRAALVLRDAEGCRFEQLMDLCGLDYADYGNGTWDGPRFCVAVHLLSVSLNQRVRVKVLCPDDDLPLVELREIFATHYAQLLVTTEADWLADVEREAQLTAPGQAATD